MEAQSPVKKPEAGLQPASFASGSASATTVILMGGAFLATGLTCISQLFYNGIDEKELQRTALIMIPGLSQTITALALWAYKRNARRNFRAFCERKIYDIDQQIARLPTRLTLTVKQRLSKLEERRKYWEDLLDHNERTYIDAE